MRNYKPLLRQSIPQLLSRNRWFRWRCGYRRTRLDHPLSLSPDKSNLFIYLLCIDVPRSATEKVSERKCSEYTRNGCIMHTPQIRISVRLRTLKAFIMIIIIIIMVITNEGGGDDEDDG